MINREKLNKPREKPTPMPLHSLQISNKVFWIINIMHYINQAQLLCKTICNTNNRDQPQCRTVHKIAWGTFKPRS
jgi:hypothetical protein